LIVGDPYKLSVVIQNVREWNGNGDVNSNFIWHNGILIIIIDGMIFPDLSIINITLNCAVGELIQNLKCIPINHKLFNIGNTETAFVGLYNSVYPPNDSKKENLNYIISPQEFLDKNIYIFAVKENDVVRFLGAKLKYNYNSSRHLLRNIEVHETYVDGLYLENMIEEISQWEAKYLK